MTPRGPLHDPAAPAGTQQVTRAAGMPGLSQGGDVPPPAPPSQTYPPTPHTSSHSSHSRILEVSLYSEHQLRTEVGGHLPCDHTTASLPVPPVPSHIVTVRSQFRSRHNPIVICGRIRAENAIVPPPIGSSGRHNSPCRRASAVGPFVSEERDPVGLGGTRGGPWGTRVTLVPHISSVTSRCRCRLGMLAVFPVPRGTTLRRVCKNP